MLIPKDIAPAWVGIATTGATIGDPDQVAAITTAVTMAFCRCGAKNSGNAVQPISLVEAPYLCIDLCMSFKTISLSEDAYKILKRAKRSPKESFTEVVRRAAWEEPSDTMGDALDSLELEFGRGKTAVTAEELETSRRLHSARKSPR